MAKSVLFLVVFLNLFFVFSQEISSESRPVSLPEKGICAHRGANETHPENTIMAFREAIRLGAHMIEFDVQMTKDNQLVIMHDASVDRTTNGKGLISSLTLEEIQRLDAGRWKSEKFKGEKVPTLEEALRVMPQNIWLNIHLKGTKKLGRETAKIVLSEKRGHQAIIACGYKAKKGVRQVSADINICNMERLSSRSRYITNTIQKKYAFIQLKKSRDNDDFMADVQRLKRNKVGLNYFHTESKKEMEQLFKNGIDFILTDRLEHMLEAYKAYHSRNEAVVE